MKCKIIIEGICFELCDVELRVLIQSIEHMSDEKLLSVAEKNALEELRTLFESVCF